MTEFNYGALRSAEEFEGFVERIITANKPFGFDVEAGYTGSPKEKDVALKTYHPNWILVGFSFTNSLEWARYVPIAHDTGDNVDDPVRFARAVWSLLNSGLGVAHNAMYELNALGRWFRETLSSDSFLGKAVQESKGFFPLYSDSMIESFLVAQYDPLRVGQTLKGLTLHVFGHQMILFDELFEELIKNKVIKSTEKRFNILELTPKVITYACEDALWCLALHRKNFPTLQAMPVYDIVYKAEIALLRVVAEMEYEGLLLNWASISAKLQEVESLRDAMNEEIQSELSDRLGEVININLGSVKQLTEILFDRLGIEPDSRFNSEKTGAPSTSEPALRAIAKSDPIVNSILKYREVVKLVGSYLKKYQDELHYTDDGRAYPNHKQTGTVTGRFSVDGVSYQQWPKPYHYELRNGTVFDLNFRDFLVSPDEFRIVGFDFSQVELRVLAGVANETAMIQAFESGIDIHIATAATMLGVPVDQVTKEQRQLGKTLNFAIVYGSGASGIANLIGCTKAEAEVHLENYFAAFPGIKRFMDEQVRNGHDKGYIENLFGRRIKVWEFLDTRSWMVAKGERFCGNAPIQGGAGDYLKIGMVRVAKAVKAAGLEEKIKMVITFHDALEFYVHDSVTTQEVIDLIGPAVSYPLEGLPEIRADWHEGYQWGSLAEISLDEMGQVDDYELTVEPVGADKQHWEGKTLHDVLDPFYFWASDFYGDSYHELDYYLQKNPEAVPTVPEPHVFVEAEVVEDATPVEAVITLSQMPLKDDWARFKKYLAEHPGETAVTVVTPEGTLTLDEKHNLSEDGAAGIVSMLLGGARLVFPVRSSDEDSLLAGLDL